MNIQEFRDYINSLCSEVIFDYNGKPCGVDPINRQHIEMWCGDTYAEAKSIDEVFTLPIFDGKTLTQIYGDIQNMDR